MQVFKNPLRGQGLGGEDALTAGDVVIDTTLPRAVFSAWDGFNATPLISAPQLAAAAGVGTVWLKNETVRLDLGSFKALGGAYAVARVIMKAAGLEGIAGARELHQAPARSIAAGMTFLTASAGNHGIAVAAGARQFGAKARIFLNETVPESFRRRLESLGAEVDRTSSTYDDSLAAAREAADRGEGILLSDTTWPGYTNLPRFIMQGYAIMLEEAAAALTEAPTHIFLQAGVGGLACALAAKTRTTWGNSVCVVVVEPDRAACLKTSVETGRSVVFEGPVSNMGRLDCKEPSLTALRLLAREADYFATISDEGAEAAVRMVAGAGLATTPSGAAGVAALLGSAEAGLSLSASSRLLCIISETTAP